MMKKKINRKYLIPLSPVIAYLFMGTGLLFLVYQVERLAAGVVGRLPVHRFPRVGPVHTNEMA